MCNFMSFIQGNDGKLGPAGKMGQKGDRGDRGIGGPPGGRGLPGPTVRSTYKYKLYLKVEKLHTVETYCPCFPKVT